MSSPQPSNTNNNDLSPQTSNRSFHSLRSSHSRSPSLEFSKLNRNKSASTLNTLSQLHQDIDKSSPARLTVSANTSPNAINTNPNATLRKPTSSSSTPNAAPRSLLPSRSANKTKKLHKRVLSGSSSNEIQYFNLMNQNKSSTTIHEDVTASSPGPKLPTFNKVNELGDRSPPSASSAPANQQQQFNSAISANDNFAIDLSASKIFDRRKQREKQQEEEFHQDFVSSAELPSILVENDPQVEKNYHEKFNRLKDEKLQKKARKKAEFHTNDTDVENNNDSDSDLDFNSDSSSTNVDKNEIKKSNSTSNESSKSNSESTDNKNDETAGHKIKRFLKKVVQPEEYSDSLESDVDSEEELDESNGFFSKLVAGGLVPGATKASSPEKLDDEENQLNQVNKEQEGIPLQDLDPNFAKEAKNIVQAHAHIKKNSKDFLNSDESTLKDSVSGASSSHQEGFFAPNPDYYLRDNYDDDEFNEYSDNYIAPPKKVQGGVLSSLLKLYQNTELSRSQQRLSSAPNSPYNSAFTTPTSEVPPDLSKSSKMHKLKNLATGGGSASKKKVAIDDDNLNEQQEMLKNHRKNASFSDLTHHFFKPGANKSEEFLSATPTNSSLANLKKNASYSNLPTFEKTRSKVKKSGQTASGFIKSRKEAAQAKITVHIANILQRQRFILRMCKALMLYGAPTHRLEEAMTMTGRVLEIDAQFIYLPGCMIVSFGDATTRTSEVQLVRSGQGLNLYKLHRVHRIYKKVIHDLIGVEEASSELDELVNQKPLYPAWACVLIYGFSSAMVTPFAFGGGWVNLAVSFGIGLCVGALQFLVAPRSNLYSNVFEVSASIVVSFIGRALGSISGSNICFSAVVQGSLALILPGYIILCGSLELQSRNLVAGSVRMFYAVIYSLFLGFGITLGAAIYGWIDKSATSETTCAVSISPWYRFIFVPMFTLGLCLINQAKLFQIPIMLIISCAGYVVSYFASKHFYNSTEFTSAMGAFVIGILGNLYSRVFKGLAVSAMLPAIFVQVPGGIASQGSLLAGIQNANALVSNSTESTTTSNSGSALGFGVTMIQVAVGISVGLFASALVVYPFGKKSTSIFTL